MSIIFNEVGFLPLKAKEMTVTVDQQSQISIRKSDVPGILFGAVCSGMFFVQQNIDGPDYYFFKCYSNLYNAQSNDMSGAEVTVKVMYI